MKKQPLHIIYLSGFGNKYDVWRLRLMKKWRFKNVTIELLPMRWEGRESFVQKVARVDQAIDRASGKRIVLLGESAGGTMAVYMYARRPGDFYKVMTICGKNVTPHTVGDYYFQKSPAYKVAVERLVESAKSLTKQQHQTFVSIHPLHDSVVPVNDTLLKDCTRVRLFSVGHLFTIFMALTFYSFIVVRQAKK